MAMLAQKRLCIFYASIISLSESRRGWSGYVVFEVNTLECQRPILEPNQIQQAPLQTS